MTTGTKVQYRGDLYEVKETSDELLFIGRENDPVEVCLTWASAARLLTKVVEND